MASEIVVGSDELIADRLPHLRESIRGGGRASCGKLHIAFQSPRHRIERHDEIVCEGDSVEYEKVASLEPDGWMRVGANLYCGVEPQLRPTNAKPVDKVMTDVIGEDLGHLPEPTGRWEEAIYNVDDVAADVGRVRLSCLPMRGRAHRPEAKSFASHESNHHERKIESAEFWRLSCRSVKSLCPLLHRSKIWDNGPSELGNRTPSPPQSLDIKV